MKKLWVLCALLLSMLPGSAFAQGGGNVAITGTVTDPSGAVLPGAQIKVTQKNTSVTRVDTSNSSGQFNVSSLPLSCFQIFSMSI